MRRFLFLAILLMILAPLGMAQGGNTTVTAIIRDPNGALYTNSQVNITFFDPGTPGKQPLLNGSVFQTTYTIFATDSFGRFTQSVADNGIIDSSSGTVNTQWSFRVIYSDRLTSFVYSTPINCAANIPTTCTNGVIDISAQLQAVAALLPAQAGGGGSFVVRGPPCASTINFQMAGTFPTTANTAFNVALNCNVSSTSITQAGGGGIQTGAIAQFTLIQDAIGGRSFAWPSNFIDQPPIQVAALQTTNASFWYDGTNWHAQTFPASGGGGGGNPAGVSGDVQKNNGVGAFAVSGINDNGTILKFKEDSLFCGQSPYIDVRCYNVRALVPTNTPVIPGITANITSGTPTVTVSTSTCAGQASNVCFLNGDGVVIYGAGASHSMTTPTGVTVTPSLALAGTGTGFVVNGPVGATTYNYQVIARDKNGGITAASSVASTVTGAASLGSQSVTISTLTRSGNIVTGTTTAPHGLSIGAMIWIGKGVTDETNWGGWYNVATVPDNTHFTFQSGMDTVNGAPTSATGGTVFWFNANHIAWSAVTGAWEYCVYGRIGGSLTWIGCGRPQGTNITDLTFDDFGSPMMDNYKRPGVIPNTPPGAATSDSLVTTIASGAGTITLTLADNALTTVAGAIIRVDNSPNILTAANVARNINGLLHFPPVGTLQFPINSYLTLPSNLTVSFASGLFINDTVQVGFGSKWIDVIPQGQPPTSFSQFTGSLIGVSEANPGVYSAAGNLSYWKGLNFLGQGISNGGNPIFIDQNSPATFENSNIISSSAASDYMGVGIILRGSEGLTSFVNTFKNVLISGGPTQVDGVTATPGLICDRCGITDMYSLNLGIRSLLFRPAAAGGNFSLTYGRQQGGITPTVMYYNNSGNSTITSNVISHFDQDSMPHPIFTNFGGAASELRLEGSGYPGNFNGSNGPLVSGFPIRGIFASNTMIVNGQNRDVYSSNQAGTVQDTTGLTTNVNRSMAIHRIHDHFPGSERLFWDIGIPAAPTATVAAGGALANGTYTYRVAAMGFDGGMGVLSPTSTSCVVAGGNQTCNVSWTGVVGANLYAVYRSLNGGGVLGILSNLIGCAGAPTGSTSFSDTGALATCAPAPSDGASGVVYVNKSEVAAPIFRLNAGTSSFSTVLANSTPSANRTQTFPDNTGPVANLNFAQIWTANQSYSNGTQVRFFSPNGTNYTSIQGPSSNGVNVNLVLPNANSVGVQCFNNDGSGNISYSNCSGGTGTPGGADTQVQSNSTGTFGGSPNLTWVSPALTVGLNATATGQVKYKGVTSGTVTTQSQDAAGTWTFKWPATGGTSGFPMVTDGTGVASWSLLGLAGGGTNSGAGAFTNTQLVGVTGGALASLAGTLTGTNPVLTLTSALTTSVPFALNTPASPTADIFDININTVKTSWVDNLGIWHAPSYTATGSGALALSGTEGTCPSPAGGIDILCIGNLATHTIQSSLNGAAYKDNAQFSNSGPAAHGVCLVGAIFPQLNCTTAGTSGQAFISAGAGADGSFGTLGAVGGGTGNVTNTLHGVGMGEGTSPLNFSAAGVAGQAFISGGAGADGSYGTFDLSLGTNTLNNLPINRGGTGSSTLAAANIVTVTGAITPNDCVKWSSSTVVTDSGGTCGGAGGSARLDQLLGGTAINTINSTIFPQVWNWALTGSTTAFKFGENTAATGASNILLQASTLNTSTAVPFQTDSNGNGYQLNSSGLFKPIGTGAIATPGAANNLVVSRGSSTAVSYIPPVAAGKVLIDNGPGVDPSFQDPIISQAFVPIWTAQDVTTTRTSAAVRNPIFSQTGTLELTWASITGAPATCTLQIQGVDSVGNALNNGSTFSVSPANGTTSQTFTAAAGLQSAAQIKAIFACVTYPTTGTLTLDYTPIPNVNVTNTVTVAGTVTTTPPSNASTNITQVAGTTTSVNNGTTDAGTQRVTIASDSTGQIKLATGTALAGEIVPVATATTTDTTLRCTLVSAASTNATNCKASAGNVYGYRFVNTTTTIYYLRMYNLTTSPTCSSATGFIESIPIPPAGAAGQAGGIVSMQPFGEGYGTGIAFCFTGGSASTDNTNAATGVFGTILYK